MSPTASATGTGRPSAAQAYLAPAKSLESSPKKPSKSSKPSSPAPIPAKPAHYTVILRFPFPRNGFVDPEPVIWDAVKDKALWKIISKAGSSKDLNWPDIADKFEVDLPFLMQQAAWLYERHFEGMRVQMQRLASGPAPTLTSNDPIDGSGSKALAPTTPIRKKESSLLPTEASSSPKPAAPPGISRTPSTTTITQSRLVSRASSLRQRPLRTTGSSQRRPVTPDRPTADFDGAPAKPSHDGEDESSSESEQPMLRSQAFRRPPLGSAASRPSLGTLSSEGDEVSSSDDPSSSGGYLPFATATMPSSRGPDPAATLRGTISQRGGSSSRHVATARDDSSTSASASSASAQTGDAVSVRPGPLSPRHRAQLKAMSPRAHRVPGAEASEGSPSMGSSFSDLETTSITQSALEEAVISNLQAGGGSLASRIGGLGKAFSGGSGKK